ncbi:MAG: heavy-metal-associated domain-containing protein [Bacteroidetes bacterium]|nr:heavy-metal-associated domain-containing protein [Bacteroidota bacterium]
MKPIKILITCIVMLTISLPSYSTFAQAKKKASIVEFNVKVNFQDVKGKELIEKEIKKEAGVSSVFVNLSTKLVTINFDGNTTDREKIISAIEKIGFTTNLSSKDKKPIKACSQDAEKKSSESKK